MSTLSFEKARHQEGYLRVAGVDEAGRGPLAGPLVIAAALLKEGAVPPAGIDDSKKLSHESRERLFDAILDAFHHSLIFIDPSRIDQINILQATYEGMCLAVQSLFPAPDFVLVDGPKLPPKLHLPGEAIIKGDGLSISIAAASIIAKVSRDRYMQKLSESYPEYGFDRHKGYPTKAHYEAIALHGILEHHRKSFLRNLALKK